MNSACLFTYVQIASLAFWDAYLKGDPRAKAYLSPDRLPAYSQGTVKLSRK